VEWVLAHWGNFHIGVCTVALYDTLGVAAFKYIVNQTELITIACSGDFVRKIAQYKIDDDQNAPKMNKLKYLVTFDNIADPDIRQKLSDAGLTLYSFQEVLAKGAESELEEIIPDENDTFMLSYTSGTTGDPKGVRLTHKMMTMMCYNNAERPNQEIGLTKDDVYLSYLPLAHSLE